MNIFFDYSKKTKNTAWSYFLPMLNRQDLFTVHMVSMTTPHTNLQLALRESWRRGRDGVEGEREEKKRWCRGRKGEMEERSRKEEDRDYSKADFVSLQNDQQVITMLIGFPSCGLLL